MKILILTTLLTGCMVSAKQADDRADEWCRGRAGVRRLVVIDLGFNGDIMLTCRDGSTYSGPVR